MFRTMGCSASFLLPAFCGRRSFMSLLAVALRRSSITKEGFPCLFGVRNISRWQGSFPKMSLKASWCILVDVSTIHTQPFDSLLFSLYRRFDKQWNTVGDVFKYLHKYCLGENQVLLCHLIFRPTLWQHLSRVWETWRSDCRASPWQLNKRQV